MSHRFDDMIRKHLEKQESAVPGGLFDKIKNHPDVQDAMFDGAIKSKLLAAEGSVPDGLFEKIQAGADLDNLTFDSSVAQKLGSFESAVPVDMWDRIQGKKDRRRPVIFWWMAAALIGTLAIGGVLWKYEQPGSNKMNATATKSKFENSKDANHVTTNASQPSTDESIITKSNPNQPQQPSTATSQKDDVIQSYTSSKNNKGITDFKSVDSKITSASFSKKQSTNITAEKPINQTDETENDLQSVLGNDVISASIGNNSFRHVQVIPQLLNHSKMSPRQLLKAKALTPVLPCPSIGDDERNDWYIDAYSSAMLLQKNVQDNFNNKNASAGFDSTLHQQVSINAGINVVKNIGNNFLFKTGIQYNRINEAFRVTRINERRLITTISVRTVIISPGDTVYIRDTSTVTQIGTIKQGRQNTYTQWDLPVIIGYEFGGKALKINANVGLIANIRSSYNGLLLDTLQQPKDINNINGQAAFRKNVGFSFYAGLSLVKPITNRLSLMVEPHARIGLSNLANDQMWFRQKNSLYGISIGLRYKFNNSGQRIY